MDIRLPRLAEGADSGTVVSVLVEEGDQVDKDQTIIEIENEKATAPIPSTEAGVVKKIHVNEGDTVTVGQVIASLSTDGKEEEAKEKPEEKTEEEAEEKPERPAPVQEQGYKLDSLDVSTVDPILGYQYESRSGYPPPASPTIRKLAKDIGLDLTRVRGSARGGRIVLEDIKTYIKRLQDVAFGKLKEAQKRPATAQQQSIDFSKWGSIEKKPLSSLRKTIGKNVLDFWTTVPHVYQLDEADITDMLSLRKKHKSAYEEQGAKLTLTAFAIKVVCKALEKYPIFNSSLDETTQEIVYKKYMHIGIAVDTPDGLIVPVIRDANEKSLFDLSKELQEIAEKARDRKLSGEDLKGSSFTISNLGGIGGTHFTPIVYKPNVAILGIGKGVTKPVSLDGKKVEVRTTLPLCVSYDHRVIDGADGARFITEIVNAYENFEKSEVKL